MVNKLKFSILIYAVFAISCGTAVVDINQNAYQPKIVMQATLFPNQSVDRIKISRNFPLNTRIDNNSILLPDADVQILDESGKSYRMTFDLETGYFKDGGTGLVIEYGKSYTLEVRATIDGRALFARSSTTVPLPGFKILESESVLDSMVYRERDENDEVKEFKVAFSRSPGTTFYALSLTALEADTSTFIFDNPFDDFDVEDIVDDIDDLTYNFDWILGTPVEAGKSTMEIFWFFTWFYGEYQAIVYAADQNFKDFLITHDQVQELDGNLHEPAFHIEGDGIGIGVFGSAIADTVHFKILREQTKTYLRMGISCPIDSILF